jgi:hypothetical protein
MGPSSCLSYYHVLMRLESSCGWQQVVNCCKNVPSLPTHLLLQVQLLFAWGLHGLCGSCMAPNKLHCCC